MMTEQRAAKKIQKQYRNHLGKRCNLETTPLSSLKNQHTYLLNKNNKTYQNQKAIKKIEREMDNRRNNN